MELSTGGVIGHQLESTIYRSVLQARKIAEDTQMNIFYIETFECYERYRASKV